MMHSFTFLEEWIQGEQISRITVSDIAEWTILTFLNIAVRNAH